MRVAYLVSRFPKLTETFVLNEILAIEKHGVSVELYPLLRERTQKMHPEAERWVRRAHYTPFISLPILRSNLNFLLRKPRPYLQTLKDLLWGTRGSVRFLTGAMAIFPKSVYLAERMMKDGIPHIHAHFASHPAAAAFIIHRLTGIPYSFTAHGSDIHRDQHMLAEKTAEAAFVVPISRFNRDVILRASGGKYSEKMRVIHCGVDIRKFQPNGKKSTGNDPVRILCIGTLHEVKGQTHLIEACRILNQTNGNFTCHFIGDGPDLPALEEQVRKAGLECQVFFHGRLDQKEVLEHLHQADLLVAPSVPSKDGRREGIPVVLMEAMACNLPVISSRLSGIPEIVEDGVNGLLTEPGDSQALAQAIHCLSSDPALRKQYGLAGRQKVEVEFDLSTSSLELARLFSGEGIQ